jgi:starch-binding outer membrane protein, SusD/RagB family
MKKVLYLIIAIFALYGCSKEFLEKTPTTSLVIENFYQTPDDAKQAVTAIYNNLLVDDWWSYYIASEIASDNCAGGAGSGDGGGFQRWDRGIQWPGNSANQEAWNLRYGGIFRANVYLENEALIDWEGKETLRMQYQSEARFLRGYFHFYLARMLGEIPYLDHTILPGEPIPGRTPAEELYSYIIDDFIFCAENGLDDPYASMSPENWGRATKWAAEAMIARAYLYYSGYYNDESVGELTAANVQTYIDDVVTGSGHALVPEFASLWRVPAYSELGGDTSIAADAGEVNPECVWSIRYDISGNPFQWFARMIGPRNVNIDPYGQGWGGMPVMPTLWNLYDDADKRKRASILSWDEAYAEDTIYFYDWSSASVTQAQYTGYNCKKNEIASVGGIPECGSLWQQNAFEDYMVIRYADVLLMAAELHLLTGSGTSPASLVNQVRERAFGDASHNLGSVTLDDIFLERRLELAFEGSRWEDIKRSCKGNFDILAELITYNDENDGGVDYSNTADVFSLDVDGQLWAEKKGLFQIPPAQIDLMEGAIEQNPGYTE